MTLAFFFFKNFWVHLLGDTMGCREDPLGSDESCSTKVLIEGVDQSHLPAPLPILAILSAHHASPSPPTEIGLESMERSLLLIVLWINQFRLVHGLLVIVIGAELVALQTARFDKVTQFIVVNLDGHNGGSEDQSLIRFVEVTGVAGGGGDLASCSLYSVLGTGIGDQRKSLGLGSSCSQSSLDSANVLGVDMWPRSRSCCGRGGWCRLRLWWKSRWSRNWIVIPVIGRRRRWLVGILMMRRHLWWWWSLGRWVVSSLTPQTHSKQILI